MREMRITAAYVHKICGICAYTANILLGYASLAPCSSYTDAGRPHIEHIIIPGYAPVVRICRIYPAAMRTRRIFDAYFGAICEKCTKSRHIFRGYYATSRIYSAYTAAYQAHTMRYEAHIYGRIFAAYSASPLRVYASKYALFDMRDMRQICVIYGDMRLICASGFLRRQCGASSSHFLYQFPVGLPKQQNGVECGLYAIERVAVLLGAPTPRLATYAGGMEIMRAEMLRDFIRAAYEALWPQ